MPFNLSLPPPRCASSILLSLAPCSAASVQSCAGFALTHAPGSGSGKTLISTRGPNTLEAAGTISIRATAAKDNRRHEQHSLELQLGDHSFRVIAERESPVPESVSVVNGSRVTPPSGSSSVVIVVASPPSLAVVVGSVPLFDIVEESSVAIVGLLPSESPTIVVRYPPVESSCVAVVTSPSASESPWGLLVAVVSSVVSNLGPPVSSRVVTVDVSPTELEVVLPLRPVVVLPSGSVLFVSPELTVVPGPVTGSKVEAVSGSFSI